MMARNILIGIGAGIATALLSLGPATGALLSVPLYFLSPLPIAIAGLGFGTWSGAAAAATAAVILSATLGDVLSGILFVAIFGAPVAWAAHLVGLSRPADEASGAREWFPLDMVLIRVSLACAVAVVVWLTLRGYDAAALTQGLLNFFVAVLADDSSAATRAELEPLARMLASLTPLLFGMWSLFIVVLNTWLGARIVRMSQLLQRPWTPLWSVTLPRYAVPFLVVLLPASFLPGSIGDVAAAFAGTFLFAFALIGFGYVHWMLRGKPGKPALLALLYMLAFLFNPTLVVMALLGVADSFFGWRGRQPQIPPLPPAAGPRS